ncbi:IS66 family transposase [Photobacterium gaetbulicola]|uniref:IS66 family transposase n=1 Tax=Photobacterium gaetbulicola TaxID=1295392 RepID=UPI00068D116F|nr:transposase [Photobacterium gaetbulicola]
MIKPELRLNAERSLARHEEHPLPVMKQIRDRSEAELENGNGEENSGLGKAISYFNQHYEGLTVFCRIEGAQFDNNQAEPVLKMVVRHHKNAMLHKTQAGASIADMVMPMIATSAEAGINVLDYFNLINCSSCKAKSGPPPNCSSLELPISYLNNRFWLRLELAISLNQAIFPKDLVVKLCCLTHC